MTCVGDLGAEITQIAKDFPGWSPWRSSAGRWWCTRLGDIKPRHDRDPDWKMTVDADTADELRDELRAQMVLDTKAGVQ